MTSTTYIYLALAFLAGMGLGAWLGIKFFINGLANAMVERHKSDTSQSGNFFLPPK